MTQNTKKYTIYDKTVKDSNGEEVDNDINYNANGDTYNKWIQPIGEEEKKSLAEQGVSQREFLLYGKCTRKWNNRTACQ